ncbi:MAG: hypothetical protein OXN44_02675 [Acidimicrobiaceae bacterium]|nr:hypothetical protein [Acidimicrobiaceae bacterium]
MILTGSAIARAVADRSIVIDPYEPVNLNPNSYNYRLGPELYEARQCADGSVEHVPVEVENGRVLLRGRQLYLGHTLERIGSDYFVTSLIGRSSIGRLGLFVQLSADLGHQGAVHRWTLELFPAIELVSAQPSRPVAVAEPMSPTARF